MSSINENLFDIRVVERNIARGKITREQYEAYLTSLEDCEEMGQETATQFIHRIEDEDDKKDNNRRRRRR